MLFQINLVLKYVGPVFVTIAIGYHFFSAMVNNHWLNAVALVVAWLFFAWVVLKDWFSKHDKHCNHPA